MLKFIKLILPVVLLCLLPQRQMWAADESVSDVRVVVDISGSMKKNDPNNLRAPAVRMLVGLMPEEARTGVWTFAKMVNMLVPWKPVNDDWRQTAIEKSSQIHSLGLFTDIEQALKKATANQKQANPKFRRSMILLSDGFIDLQAGNTATQKSRQRILDELVPKLKKTQIAVHTIALSENADHELLKALSMATDGWYQRADNAEDLQRIFLHLFEKATQRDTVPLADNQFSIDDSVTEMTVLAFRQKDTAATTLTLPDGSRLTQSDRSDAIRWQHDSSYDLITIDNPATGQWQINAELDPDNRVMVVTDMQLETTDLPNNVLLGEKFDFEATLTEKGNVITRDGFLKLVDGTLAQDKQGEVKSLTLLRQPDKSKYRATLGNTFSDGRHDVIVTMKSATFERQRRQTINVIAAPINVEVEQLDQQTRSHRIQVQADDRLIKPDSLTITALLREEDGSEWPYDLLKTGDNNWRLTLTELEAQKPYQLSLQLRGETPEGRKVFLQPEPLTLMDSLANATSESEVVSEDASDKPEVSMTETAQAEKLIEPETEQNIIEQNQAMSDNMKLLIGNAIILLLLLAGVVWWRKQTASTVVAGDLI
ncbi:VWA domain-containing protein [Methylophaga thiooxydans]|uniref:VWA domain-containing protein n=1 Tax=Methylophaga thiooxydans TaxID=392484 RepID=UPI0023537AC7|nr:vWA domain-containing protein [Methylophaga thiooxydans]